ncbi:hypothetical protein IWW55_004843, partial [Coemansia sp. RSA 2706]
AIIFILRREWQHIGWMIIYLLAYPLWSCILPIYSFWHMDDFSWGNTRVVVGDGKRKLIVKDDKPFDPASIPQRKWMEYEAELNSAGVLNAPPPNMNPNAGSSREDDRGTMFSRQSGAMGSASRHGGNTPVPGAVRAGTPTTIISGSGSVDPRLQLSTPVAQAQQQQQYQSGPGYGDARPVSTVGGVAMPADGTIAARGASYQYSPTSFYDNTVSPGQPGFGMFGTGASVSPHALHSPGQIDYFSSPVLGQPGTQSRGSPGAAMIGAYGQQQQPTRESIYSAGSYGVPSMYGQPAAGNSALQGGGTPGMMMTGAMPTDEQLIESIKRILSSQNLNSVTKKSVRAQLAAEYGVDLTARKEFIGDAIELILAGQL